MYTVYKGHTDAQPVFSLGGSRMNGGALPLTWFCPTNTETQSACTAGIG